MHSRPLVFFAGVLTASIMYGRLIADESSGVEPKAPATNDQQTGSVEGTVIYRADAERPWRYARYYVKDRHQGQLAEAVVALKFGALKRESSDEAATVVVDQKDFQFIPETVAIRAGDRVKFLNNDKEVHNVRTVHPRHSFNANVLSGSEQVETFREAGGIRLPYQVECAYHSAMRSWIYVFDHPYYQLTRTDGRFRLAKIPQGEYILEMAHPAGQLRWSRKIHVAAGKTTQLDIVVSPGNRPDNRP
jgi:plastocyanin